MIAVYKVRPGQPASRRQKVYELYAVFSDDFLEAQPQDFLTQYKTGFVHQALYGSTPVSYSITHPHH
jgi:hypothetical protein